MSVTVSIISDCVSIGSGLGDWVSRPASMAKCPIHEQATYIYIYICTYDHIHKLRYIAFNEKCPSCGLHISSTGRSFSS